MGMDFSEFDRVVDRRGTGSLKWERYAGRDVRPLWVADMDFVVAPEILEAVHRRTEHGILGYSVAHDGVKEAIVEYLASEHGVQAHPDWLVFLPGMVPALAQTSQATGKAGDSILICTPVYPPFFAVNKDTDRELISVPLRQEGGIFTLDFPALEAAVKPNTRLMILCNPHNPVGRVFSAAEMQQLAEFCVRHDIVLCSDEIHCDLLLEPEQAPHTTALKFADLLGPRLVTLMAASKTFNIPGLGCSFAIIPDADFRRRFRSAKSTWVAEVNPLGYHATEAAYRCGRPWRDKLQAYLRRNRDTMAAFFQKELPQISMPHMEATYLALLDVNALKLSAPMSFFENHGLGFSNGADFGAPGSLRFNFGTQHAVVEECLQKMLRAVGSLS